jgi:beta-glucosidase
MAKNDEEKDISVMNQKIDSLIKEMTLEEKIGQLTLFTSDWDVTGPAMRSTYKDDIRSGKTGSIFNAYTAKYNYDLQKIAVEETRLHIPLLFGYDVIHGHRTIFPISLGESCSWDLSDIEKSARIAAVEASAEGIHWTFAPMMDIARDPRWGRISEGAGEDTYLGTLIAKARVKGFQGDDLSAPDSLLACAKHYCAYGAAQAGRDYSTVDMSQRELWSTYLPPFKGAVDAGVCTFMSAFNELDGVPCTGNKYLLDEILRKKWRFSGFVVSDYTSVNEMICHGIVADEKEAALLAFNAGLDMDMQGALYYKYLPELVKEGKVSIKQIDNSVRRILEMKYKKGLFDNPYLYCDEKREKNYVMTQEFLDHARNIARKSIVLLKNEKHILPLKKDVKTIALIGPLADNKENLIGSWCAAGDYKKSVSVMEGIKAKSSAEILYKKGCDITGTDKTGFKEALEAAKTSDVIVAVMGESSSMSGEASSRSNLDLPGVQKELLMELKKTGKPVVLILMNGRPLTISWEAENINGILETWYLGTEAGNAIADVLFGDYNPSGKLTVTFPRNVGQIPVYYNMKNTGRPMDEKNKYTSKYLDTPNSPLYPFGYGLSYTTFEYSPLSLDKKEIGLKDSIKVSVTVKNTGTVTGEEVVQLYVRDLVGSVTRPLKELKGFKKVIITPGKSETVVFEITAKDLAFYRRDMSYGVEAGDFKVFVGTNSSDVKEGSFRLTQTGVIQE